MHCLLAQPWPGIRPATVWIHSWDGLELVANFHVKCWSPTQKVPGCSCSWYCTVTAVAENFVRGYGLHCIRKGRRPEKCERERTEKMADRKYWTEKTAKAEFRTNTGR